MPTKDEQYRAILEARGWRDPATNAELIAQLRKYTIGAENRRIREVAADRLEELLQHQEDCAQIVEAYDRHLIALKRLIEPHFDEDGVIEIFSASTIVGTDRNGRLQLKGSFIAALEVARVALQSEEKTNG